MSILVAVGFLVFGGIVLAIDLIFGVFVGGIVIVTLWATLSPTRKTTGEVVEISKGRTALGTRVRVAYYTPDGRFETSASVQRPRLGEQLAVRYNPGKPARASIAAASRVWRPMAIMIPMIVVFGALAIGMIISSVWRFAGNHAALQNPVGGGSFFLTFALLSGLAAVLQYRAMWKWRRMTRTDGKILQHIDEPKPGTDETSGILISFQTAEGDEEEFWAQANVPGDAGESVAVYYDPEKPAATATVATARDHRHTAFISTTFTVVFLAATVLALMTG